MQQEAVLNVVQTAMGPIKIHGPTAFDGMRRAGRLAAETLGHDHPPMFSQASPPKN